jgi:hypothetical protein
MRQLTLAWLQYAHDSNDRMRSPLLSAESFLFRAGLTVLPCAAALLVRPAVKTLAGTFTTVYSFSGSGGLGSGAGADHPRSQ